MQSKMLGKLPVESTDKFGPRIRSIPTRGQQIKDSGGRPIIDLGESSKLPIREIANLKDSVLRFGPLYPVKQEAADAIKEKAWEHVLRNSSESPDTTKEVYSTAMRQVEQQAKDMYDGKATEKGTRFRWMLIKDGCLCNQVALHILGCSEQLGYPQNDPIFGRVHNKKETKKWVEALFYPGNQLPLVVLRVLMNQRFFQGVIARAKWDPVGFGLCKKVLYELLVLPSLMTTHNRSLIDRVGAVFGKGCRGNDVEQPVPVPVPQPQPQFSDILNGFRGILLGPASQDQHPTSEDETDSEDEIWDSSEGLLIPYTNTNEQGNVVDGSRIIPSATELKQAGIHIKALESGGARGIHYRSYYFWAHIYLPPLPLDANTIFILRNLNNYESFQYPDKNSREVILYLKFMSNLIPTPREAKLLHNNGVILGKSSDVEKLPAMLKRLTSQEEDDIKLPPQVRILKSQIIDHSRPWVLNNRFVSFVAFLTFLQTLIAVYYLFKPHGRN